VKNPRAALFLAVILAAPAFALADSIPGHSKSGNNYVTFSEGFTEQQDLQGSSARCNFLLGSIKEIGSNTNSIPHAAFSEFAKGDKGSNFGALPNAGVESDSREVNLADFRGDGNKSSSFERDKGKGRGKHNGDGDGSTSGTGSETPLPVASVAEPASQTLLLFGLAGLGMLFFRRKTLTNPI
jgi:MYXO-CTERM domain-containing protein